MDMDWNTVNEMLTCAESWEPDARIIGNVRAEDIAKVCRSIIAVGQKTTTNTGCPKLPLLLEVKHALYDHDCESPDFREYEIGVLDCYKFIERQLRPGA